MRSVCLLILAALLAGCTARPAPAVPSAPAGSILASPVAASPRRAGPPPPPPGPVATLPEGCVALVFYSITEEGPVVKRSEIGNFVRDIRTPSGRIEQLVSPLKWDEIQAAIARNAAATDEDGLYALAHHPEYVGPLYMPTQPTWDYLNKYLRDDDVVWAFGRKDCGVLVIRDNHVLCVVVTSSAP